MKKRAGFTLLELLVAMAIFAVVAALAYGGLIAVMQQYDSTHTAQERLQEIRRAVVLLERDLFQVRDRSVREAYQGDYLPPLSGGVDQLLPLQFTRGGWRNPAGVPRSNLQRVAWQRDGETLHRIYWQMLDQAQDSEPVRLEVLDGVETFAVRFLDDAGQWHEQWPPLDFSTTVMNPEERRTFPLPLAVEFVLELEDAGRIRRLVEMPDT